MELMILLSLTRHQDHIIRQYLKLSINPRLLIIRKLQNKVADMKSGLRDDCYYMRWDINDLFHLPNNPICYGCYYKLLFPFKKLLPWKKHQMYFICTQGLLLVYVGIVMVLVVRQFENLSSIEEDQSRLLLVDREGSTQLETLRTVKEAQNLV